MELLPKDIALEIFGETNNASNQIYDDGLMDELKERYQNAPALRGKAGQK